MDAVEWKSAALESVKKYRYVFVVLMVGLFLMLTPDKQQPTEIEPNHPQTESLSLETSLANILSKIDGAGKTEVLLTESAGAQTYYQYDEDSSSTERGNAKEKNTILVTNSEREQTGLIRRIDPPVYQGAIILCQGASNAQVRLSIVEAVANATGLTTDKITVLKMK